MDGMYGRRDVNGKANAGLTLGIIGTALGAWALFGNRRSTGVLGTGAGLMGGGSTNINVVGVGAGNGTAPTAFQAWAMSKTVRNISVRNTICRKLTKFVVNSKIN